jgi:GPH family glycoside/pentoside/hexuronide:cation symporter
VYTEYIGLSAALVGIILSTGALIDGVSDFACGIVMDKFHTKHGKARHWLKYMAVPLALSLGFLFTCPVNVPAAFKFIYLFLIYNIYCTVITFVRLPTVTLTSLISDDDKVRSNASLFVGILATVGGTLSGMIVTPLTEMFGGQCREGYIGCMAVVGVVSGICALIGFFLSKEKESSTEEAVVTKREKVSVGVLIKTLVTNKFWLICMGGNIFSSFAFGLIMSTVAYFCTYTLGNPGAIAGIYAVCTLPMLVGIILAGFLNNKFDCLKVNNVGRVICIIGCAIAMLFNSKNGLTLLLVGRGLFVFGMGLADPASYVFLGRCATYGQWKTGVVQEGMVFSGRDVMRKITTALSAALIGFVLSAAGYTGAGNMPETGITAINSLSVYIPLGCVIVAFVFYLFFTLNTEKTDKMKEEIKARESAEA